MDRLEPYSESGADRIWGLAGGGRREKEGPGDLRGAHRVVSCEVSRGTSETESLV